MLQLGALLSALTTMAADERINPYGFYLLEPRPFPSLLSLVFPLFNEEAVVAHLRRSVEIFVGEMGCHTEVILVNDGSTDSTLLQISEWAAIDERIKIINLSRNFGHQNACTAGLDYASGDAVVILDADLQDPIAVIHEMIERYCDGYDVVYGVRQRRKGETWFKRCSAWLFYRLMHGLVDKNLPVDTGDFRLLSRHCVQGLKQLRETHRFLRGMVAWVGYPQIGVTYERAPRVAGDTKYSFIKMLKFAWTAATSFSTLPLKASIVLGIIVTVLGLEEAVRAILARIFHWYVVPGWASLTVLVSVIGGAMLVSIGILGEYVGKLYEQTKNRPLYLVSRTVNLKDADSGHSLKPAAKSRADGQT
jgi:glycosyltransferase involved in cell wall biosynthesis